MKGCGIIVWAIMLTPLVLVAVLFAISPKAGIVGLEIVLTAFVLYFAIALFLSRIRQWCPSCNTKKLKCINSFLVNPPPNFSFHRCENCGGEFVKIDGEAELVEREQPQFNDSDGWETS